MGFSERQPCKRTGWAQSTTRLAPETPKMFLEGFLETPCYCIMMMDLHAWAIPPTSPTPKVCSLVETDTGLLQLVDTLAGHGGTQVAHSATQHSFHDLHELRGFNLIVHYANLCTTTTLPVLEAAGQGQALRERTWQSGNSPACSLYLLGSPSRSFLSLLSSQRPGAREVSPYPGIQGYRQWGIWTQLIGASQLLRWRAKLASLGNWRADSWRTPLPQVLHPLVPGKILTRAFSAVLVLGPFHWIIILPRSSRKMSSLLKLFQESSTFQSRGEGVKEGDRVSYHLHPGGGALQPVPAYVSMAPVYYLCAGSCV